MTKKNFLKLELIGHSEELDTNVLIDLIEGTIKTLKNIDKNTYNTDVDWKIKTIIMHSPLELTLTPSGNTEKSCDILNNFFEANNRFNENFELPEYLDQDGLEGLRQSYRGIETDQDVYIRTSSKDIGESTAKKETLENVEKAIKVYSEGKYETWTTLKGKLESLSAKSATGRKGPNFSIYLGLYKKEIPCFISEEKFQSIHKDLTIDPIDVKIYGKVRFNTKGIPLQVLEVKEYQKIEKHFSVDELKDINITNGFGSASHIQSVRYGG